MVNQQMLARYKKLEEEIKEINEQLKVLPEGTIFYVRNGKYKKWYSFLNGEQHYIHKKDHNLAEKLAVRKFLSLKLQELNREKKAIGLYLEICESSKGITNQQLLEDDAYRNLLSPYFRPVTEELHEWMNASYEKNTKYPEQLIHKTSSGNLVRSKSEVMIEFCLHMHKIPFRYECELHLGNTIIYPDFTIRHPKTGEYYYWEHFGMMDNPAYVNNACSKIKTYSNNGIIPSIQLITTYETQEHPLSSDVVERVIEHYFL